MKQRALTQVLFLSAAPVAVALGATSAAAQDLPPPFPGSAPPAEATPPAPPPAVAAPEPPPPPPAPPTFAPLVPREPPPPPPPPPPGPLAAPPAPASEVVLTPSGYVRTLFAAIFDDGKGDDGQQSFVGKNDGFQMANARVALEAKRNHTRAYVALEGALDRRDDFNTSQGSVQVGLKDAYVEYKACTGFKVAAGQFEVPFDAETLLSNTELTFTEEAVEVRGVQGVEGFNMDGLGLDREVGLIVSGDPVYFMEKGFGLAYALAVTNGTAASKPVNDNESLAYTGRLELLWDTMVKVGVAANWNKVTTSVVPDQLTDSQFNLAVDARVDLYGGHVAGQLLRRSSKNTEVDGEPEVISQGFHFQLAYDAPWGLTPGYRYAQLDPTAEIQVEDAVTAANYDQDEIKVHTVGLSWAVPDEPLTLKVNYHIVLEDEAVKVANDRLEFLVQGVF